ncbi:MAG: BamA/TamA family outer membrane protein [Candidatus Eremiobacteraeota bacterium]|nr:BamA/TamA family outer membrane protein [Candidatus Eremiobacteraeota bacterium]
MFERLRRTPRTVLAVLAFFGLVMPPAYSAPAAAPAPTVVSVSVTGNAHIPTDRILSVVKTKVGDPFDPAVVQQDLRAIADLGFFADQAPPIVKQRPDGVAVTYRVIENPVVTSIRFEGNKSVSADTLLALMDTAPGQVFNIKTYQQDVLKLNSYYDKIGFGGQLPSHVTDVNIAPDGVLTLKVQEGLTVKNIVITDPPDGDPLLPKPVIITALVTKPGSPYSEAQRDKDYDALKALYEKYDLKLGDVEAGVDPTTVDQKAGTADVRYTISVLRVGAVEITGNTVTHDDVIRRELRLRPGMVVTDSGLRRDYDRLNNLGFFEKIDFQGKPGPDPKRPGLITVNWQVKEQRTGTATLGAGYSGGLTGTGLTGTLSYQQNNINGTGNGASVRLERGSRVSDAQISVTIPYVGKSEKSQKYSFGASLFTQQQTNFYPVYQACTAAVTTSSAQRAPLAVATVAPTGTCPASGPIPVTIVPTDLTNSQIISGVVSTYKSRSTGISAQVGRRLTDIITVSGGVNVQRVAAAADLPSGYVFPTAPVVNPLPSSTSSPFSGSDPNSPSSAVGITAPSLATISSTRPYNVRSLLVGMRADSRDDVFNPRRGINLSFNDELSSHSFGSDFTYQLITIDGAKFFPVIKNATLGLHGRAGISTGAIPTNKLFIFSDQDLRGYSDPFYGTDILLGQAELRVPLTQDRKFAVVGFVESGGTRIRGGKSITTDVSGLTTTTFDLNRYTFHSDIGLGLRFDVPQLGLHTIRLDFAKGSQGTHTSFGIGQSF